MVVFSAPGRRCVTAGSPDSVVLMPADVILVELEVSCARGIWIDVRFILDRLPGSPWCRGALTVRKSPRVDSYPGVEIWFCAACGQDGPNMTRGFVRTEESTRRQYAETPGQMSGQNGRHPGMDSYGDRLIRADGR